MADELKSNPVPSIIGGLVMICVLAVGIELWNNWNELSPGAICIVSKTIYGGTRDMEDTPDALKKSRSLKDDFGAFQNSSQANGFYSFLLVHRVSY